jgi:hypothetical protein
MSPQQLAQQQGTPATSQNPPMPGGQPGQENGYFGMPQMQWTDPNAGVGNGPQQAQTYTTSGAGQGIQGNLNMTALGDMPMADAAERQRIENMMFDRMRPQQQQSQAALEGQLANMGLTRGSEAWNREMERLGQQQSGERYDAMMRGGQEMQNLFNMGMAGRQQGFNEMLGAGNFVNQAQGQGFGQLMGQNAQNFQQGLANAGLMNQYNQQQFQNQLAANNQNWQQQLQGGNYQNQLRQQQITEMLQQRALPLNELNALLSGGQVAMPTFPGFNQSASSGGTNYLGAAGQQYNAGLDAYNAGQAGMGGLFSGLGSLGSAAMMFSDRRLKSNIRKVGEHPIGVGIYDYDIGGKRERGVMAQEMLQAAPERVGVHPSGYLMVNYEGL